MFTIDNSRIRSTLLGAACCIVIAIAMLASASRAAAAPGVVMGQPPAAFIPDWDGASDSTAVTYTLRRRSSLLVTVRVAGTANTVRTLVDEANVPAGARTDYWDGRTDSGVIVEPGDYQIVAKATPLAGGLASSQAATTVAVQTPNIAIARLSVSSGIVSRVAGHNSTSVGMSLSGGGYLSAVVVAPDGRVVRNLFVGRRSAGPVNLSWNGKTDKGAHATDGTYQVMATGSGGKFPTNTLKAPIRIDTKAPSFTLDQKSYAARVAGGKVAYSVRLKLSESARVAVAVKGMGRKSQVMNYAKGARSISIDSDKLGVRGGVSAKKYTMYVSATDAGGNRRLMSVPLTIVPPKTTAPAPAPAPPSTPPSSTPPPSSPGAVMGWPTSGPLTSSFGPRWGRMHTGIDIAPPSGTAIYAATGGTVNFSGTMSGYGNTVTIDHGGGITTLYAHQSRVAVVAGQVVGKGELIGYVGNSGNSTGPHLHFEVRTNGTPVNPIPYLS